MGFNPTITLVVVCKGRHVRFFPRNDNEGDLSGNCPAGTVVDSDVVNPVEFDFYLQSHGGQLGTSRPTHYNVLVDENEFTYVVAFLSDSFTRSLSMLTIHSGLTVYSHCRMLFVTCTPALRAPSLYLHLSTVTPIHRLCPPVYV